ncbi:hypothetical protein A3K63_02940 [Candidatus Micrarchaeota archaeon RBG_16_49_10]|nr:MAG: hypothetical protein A3K63_02940 [Candidatus Micrarchaeota archaeon RBG_16_49_10]
MLDQRLEALKELENESIQTVKLHGQQSGVDSAIKEIKLNCELAETWLRELYRAGYQVSPDLSRLNDVYSSSVTYRRLVNPLEHCVSVMRLIPNRVRDGTFVNIL